ncbi:SelT/SelW/SelH family protein [Undibacterium sp.]|jgi:selenoprotein W-related protein|uniref:SelT/SelW/SelH family protein n=1 Tax=Undibacterium sp. TaxID=1914977 RepID=UPI002C51C227|nr:SelT/SelW/SelH family protein [Undibacterium sp.]HTD06388.1 SelT/SelW/SelH family protein [Undibacterium sp.]
MTATTRASAAANAITITYCRPCGFAASAVNTAMALKARLGLESDLVSRKSGFFEVAVNGRAVARKSGYGFPDEQEIVDAVAAALEAA